MEVSVSRKKDRELTQEIFEQLLSWLDTDRDRAGVRYEEIRFQLIKIFVSHDCPDAEEMADDTINRVAGRIKDIAGTYIGNPAPYFYGVARMVYLEYLRRKPALPTNSISQETEDDERKYECLRQCIKGLTQKNRDIILAYYGEEKINANRRKELAEQFELEPNALWVRAHRIRERLKDCVSKCLKNRQAR